jgi:hypothetical protein
MALDPRVRAWLVLTSMAGLAACASNRGGDECPGNGALGLGGGCSYNVACQSWQTALVLDTRETWTIDRSSSPPLVVVPVGSRLIVNAARTSRSPSGCDLNDVTTTRWVVSDPAVLQVGSVQNDFVQLLAAAPGTARVTAENLTMPNTPPGGTGATLELSTCSDAGAPEASCSRVPLSVRVVPPGS